MPNVDTPPGLEVQQIVRAERAWNARIHQESIMFDGGEHDKLKSLCHSIRCYKAIKEELTTGVYILPDELQWYLDLESDPGEEEYAK